MGFAQHIDYPAGTTTLGSAYTAGNTSVVLATGTGSTFLGGITPTATNPLRFTMALAATPSTCCHYSCTGATGDTLTGVSVLKGTDRNFIVGDSVFCSVYGEDLNDIQNAIPALPVSVANGGTGLASTPTNGQLPIGNGTGYTLAALTAGANITITNGAGSITIAAAGGGGSGTVTSVGLSLPAIFTVSGSPVTTTGTLTGTLASQSANVVFAGPTTGVAAAPTFRALVVADLPTGIPNANLSNSSVTISGHALSLGGSLSLAAADVGLGSVTNDAQTKAAVVPNTAPTDGQILIGSTATGKYAPATLTAGSNVTITNGAGSITIASTAGGTGTVTSVGLSLPAIFTVTGSPVTTTGTLTATLAQQNANIVFAGPASGAPAAPGFRALVPADYPVFVASGASHAAGAVPDPGAVAGTTKFLREDATWAVPAGGGGSPGGSSGQVQYNSSATFAGAASLTIGSSGQLNHGSMAAPASPANNDEWHDSGQDALAYRQTGLTIYRPGLIYSQTANVTVTATGGASLVSTTGAVGTVSLPAGFLNVAGRTLRIRASFYGSTAAASQGQASLTLSLGATCVGNSGNGSLAASRAAVPLNADLTLVAKTTGVSGTLDVAGTLLCGPTGLYTSSNQAINNASAGSQTANDPTTAVTLDLTAAYTLDLGIRFSATGNSLTLTRLLIEVIG